MPKREQSPAELASQERAIASLKHGYSMFAKSLKDAKEFYEDDNQALMSVLDETMEKIEHIIANGSNENIQAAITNIAGLTVFAIQKAELSGS